MTQAKPAGESLRQGYHFPGGIEQVSVYHARDIPHDLHTTQRTALSWLLRGPQRPAYLALLMGFSPGQRRGLDSHISNMTLRIGNLCEIDSDDPMTGPMVGLVTRDGRGIIGA